MRPFITRTTPRSRRMRGEPGIKVDRRIARGGKTSQGARRLRGLFRFETTASIVQQRMRILQVQIPTLLVVRQGAPESSGSGFNLGQAEMSGRVLRRELQGF